MTSKRFEKLRKINEDYMFLSKLYTNIKNLKKSFEEYSINDDKWRSYITKQEITIKRKIRCYLDSNISGCRVYFRIYDDGNDLSKLEIALDEWNRYTHNSYCERKNIYFNDIYKAHNLKKL